MKRARVARLGKPSEVIELVDVDLPAPKAGEVEVRIEAAPINPADILKCYGHYGYGESFTPAPYWAGIEGVGRVAALGPGVTGLKEGDLVPVSRMDGIWGEAVIARADRLVALPEAVEPRQAAMITVNPPTALLMLDDFIDLQPTDWVAQNAANSAVGRHLIRLAKRRGCRTINIVRRDSLVAPLKALGADVVVVDGPDLLERVKAETDGALARLAIDAVGGAATGRIAACVETGGTVVNYGLLGGEPCQIPAQLVVFNDVRLHGFLLPRSLARRSPGAVADLYGNMALMLAEGALDAPIEATYPLDQIGAALDHAEQGERDGKILITP